MTTTRLAQLLLQQVYGIQGEGMSAIRDMTQSDWFVSEDLCGPATLRSAAADALPCLQEFCRTVDVKVPKKKRKVVNGHPVKVEKGTFAYHSLKDIVQRMLLTHGAELRRPATIPEGPEGQAEGLWSGANARENPMFTREILTIGRDGSEQVDLGACAMLRSKKRGDRGEVTDTLVRVTGVFREEQPKGREPVWSCTVKHFLGREDPAIADLGLTLAPCEVILGNRDIVVHAHEASRLHTPRAFPPTELDPTSGADDVFCYRGLDTDGKARDLGCVRD
jgi:hypothetical protein